MHIQTAHTSKSSVTGTLHLNFTYNDKREKTQVHITAQRPPLKVIRAFPLPAGGALVHLHNISGGVLGGDQLELAIDVRRGAYAQITSTSATRIYRSRPESAPAQQITQIQVAENGLLEYVPDPLIPFAGARYRQQTNITLAQGAGLFWWETVAPGRTARGELFDYDMLQIGCEISAAGRPIAIEQIKLEPQQQRFSSRVRLGPYNYFCSFFICKVGLAAAHWLQLEKELNIIAQQLTVPDEIRWGVSTLTAHGLIIRALSKRGTALPAGLLTFWRAATQALYGREAIPPRKIY
jgi:urease accessory protein